MESADRHEVGGDGDEPDREADPGAHAGAQADEREPERDQQVGERAADRRDEDRPREGMLGIGRGDGRFGRRGGVHVGHVRHRTRSEIGSLVRAMERFGFVGLPNAGKSSLYNALAGGGAHAAPYAFATTDPNVGVAKVPDHRLDALSEMSQSKQTIHAAVQFTDIGGLVEGASQGEGLGNAFLSHIREVDAIVFVLRAFGDDDVPGPQDPLEHLRVVEIELALADLASAEKARDKTQRMLKGDASLKRTVDLLDKVVDTLGEGTPLYRAGLDDDARSDLKEFFFLTNKPVMAVLNIGEDQIGDEAAIAAPVREELAGAEVVPLSVQLEAEAAVMAEEDRQEMLEALGLGDGAVPAFLTSAYHMLGLRTYLTTGEKESRAWTFRAGSTAPEAAGVIHTDFQRGFIRAETISYDDYIACKGEAGARDAGKLRIEGADYKVADGDVFHFRFNV